MSATYNRTGRFLVGWRLTPNVTWDPGSRNACRGVATRCRPKSAGRRYVWPRGQTSNGGQVSDTSEIDKQPASVEEAQPVARRETQEQPVEGSKLIEGTDDDVEFAN